MIDETIKRIEETVADADSLGAEKKQELLNLVSGLKREIAGISETHGDQARSIAGFTQMSAHEATRQERDQQLLDLSLQGLAASVERFEVSHPKLVGIVNSIHQALSNIGLG
jgi:hypothetical protein